MLTTLNDRTQPFRFTGDTRILRVGLTLLTVPGSARVLDAQGITDVVSGVLIEPISRKFPAIGLLRWLDMNGRVQGEELRLEFEETDFYPTVNSICGFELWFRKGVTLNASIENGGGSVGVTDYSGALATLQTSLDAVGVTVDNLAMAVIGSDADNSPVLAAIANLQQTIEALPSTTTGPDYAPALASLIAGQDEIRDAVAGVTTTLLAINSGQNALIEQTAALQVATAANHAAIVATLAAIAELLDPEEPPPPPPPPEQAPSAFGVAYVASQSSQYGSLGASYANLTDGDGATGGGTNGSPNESITATYAETRRFTSVTVGAGNLPGWGAVASYLNTATLQHSMDGVNWTTAWTVTGVTDSGSTQFVTHTFSAPIETQKWRLFKSGFLATTELKFA